ncbi:MAG TPA: LLM class flavin-dependent oxidoreductase [Candidatus Binataceae bacterium]|nr:LLM class flavin-dependent oxidoreductase [Candidatus Binataceae bacterium]
MKFGILTLFDHYAEDCSEERYYQNFFDEVAFAEELGFDSVWIGEHHFCRYICPAPQIVAAAIAQRTRRMRIGTAIALLPHHDPIRLAEDYALVDLLSGGRLDFGVGRGFIKATYDGLNQSMDEARERFIESLEIIERAWREPRLTYEGRFFCARNITILPRPLQKPSPPVYIAAALSPESFVMAGRNGHSIMLTPFTQSRASLKQNVQLYRETLKQSGFSPDSVEIVAGYHSFVDETPELARSKWEAHYMRYMRFVGNLIEPEEYTSSQYQSWRRSGEALKRTTFEQMYPDQVLCGDPAQCVDRVALLQEQFGVTHFWVYMDLGGLDHRELRKSMERFATRVMPQFRNGPR